jgi:hypothetical protein
MELACIIGRRLPYIVLAPTICSVFSSQNQGETFSVSVISPPNDLTNRGRPE